VRSAVSLSLSLSSILKLTLLSSRLLSSAEKVTVGDIDERALNVLKFIKLCLRAPISYPDKPERGIDTAETRELLRRSAREAIVLLKNDKKVLPLHLGESFSSSMRRFRYMR